MPCPPRRALQKNIERAGAAVLDMGFGNTGNQCPKLFLSEPERELRAQGSALPRDHEQESLVLALCFSEEADERAVAALLRETMEIEARFRLHAAAAKVGLGVSADRRRSMIVGLRCGRVMRQGNDELRGFDRMN